MRPHPIHPSERPPLCINTSVRCRYGLARFPNDSYEPSISRGGRHVGLASATRIFSFQRREPTRMCGYQLDQNPFLRSELRTHRCVARFTADNSLRGMGLEPLIEPRRILPRFVEPHRPSDGPSSTHGANQIARRTPRSLSNRFDQECFRRLHPYKSGESTFQSVFHQRGISVSGDLCDAMTAFCWPRLTLDAATP